MSEEVERSVPRRIDDESLKAIHGNRLNDSMKDFAPTDVNSTSLARLTEPKKPAVKPVATDPVAVGAKATEGVTAYISAAQHIEETGASILALAQTIKLDADTLARDLRRRGADMDKMIANFAKLAAGTQQRMADERKHLEEIAKGSLETPTA